MNYLQQYYDEQLSSHNQWPAKSPYTQIAFSDALCGIIWVLCMYVYDNYELCFTVKL